MFVQHDVMVPMRDGVHLATDIYYPSEALPGTGQAWPVILERTPYGKHRQSRSERDHVRTEPLSRAAVAEYFVAHGYVVVYQDGRGRHQSEGEFVKYLAEADDGYDTCAWLQQQPWWSWYDVYPLTAVENYAGLKSAGAPVRLILGPWTHGNRWETFSGDVDFGPAARLAGTIAPDFMRLRLDWFDHWLKGVDNGAERAPAVMLFVMGGGSGRRDAAGRLDHGGQWRAEPDWPLARAVATRFYLQEDGGLSPALPAQAEAQRSYDFDPADPVPTLGGCVVSRSPAILAGGYDQVEHERFFGVRAIGRPLAARADVLVFQTAPLEKDVEVTGPIEAVLSVSSDCPDTDFTVKLVDVYPPSADYPDGTP